MKTILLSLCTGAHVRDVLRSRVVGALLEADVTCVICTPAAGDPRFVREFRRDRVEIEPLAPYRVEGLEGKLKVARDAVFIHQKRVRSREIMVRPRSLRDWPRHAGMLVVGRGLGKSSWFGRTLARLDEVSFQSHLYDGLLDTRRPDLVVTTSPGFYEADRPLLRAARARRIPIACLVSSWDNLTSKGAMAVRPDELLVWSDAMRRDAVDYHDFPAGKISIVGVPQFDAYANPRMLLPRDAFARRAGFDPAETLITYATSAQTHFARSPALIDFLVAAIKADRWKRRCRLLVRLHPRDDGRIYERFHGIPEVIVERGGLQSPCLDWEADPEHAAWLANTMAHSSVVINLASTTTVDAAVFDTPVINIAFDDPEEPRYLHSNRRYYDYTHYRRVVDTGGLMLARSREELLEGIGRYLDNPSLDREGRRRIVDLVAYRIDGRSGERAASRLLEIAGVPASPRAMATA